MKKIAIFASGSGSNAELTSRYLHEHQLAEVVVILTDNPQAGVIKRATKLAVPCIVFDKHELMNGQVSNKLKELNVDIILLLGFLRLFTQSLIDEYPNSILNQHPALLPKYGGKGMYGTNVHRAVADNHEDISGFTLHRVNAKYDDGDILYQKSADVSGLDAEGVEAVVRALEHDYAASAIGELISAGRLD